MSDDNGNCENDMRDHRDDSRDGTINEKTRIPLGIAVATITAFMGGAIWLNNSLNKIDARLALIEGGTRDRFSGADMRIWVMQLRLDNPTLKIPEPSHN